MTIVGVDHVQLAMPSGREAEARAFYSGLLGIPEIAKPAALAARGGAWFERGTVKIHLGADADFRPARKAHPRAPGQRDRIADRAPPDGGLSGGRGRLAGYVCVFVSDPFGNRLELMEPRS